MSRVTTASLSIALQAIPRHVTGTTALLNIALQAIPPHTNLQHTSTRTDQPVRQYLVSTSLESRDDQPVRLY